MRGNLTAMIWKYVHVDGLHKTAAEINLYDEHGKVQEKLQSLHGLCLERGRMADRYSFHWRVGSRQKKNEFHACWM
jgi:hypothetical protein